MADQPTASFDWRAYIVLEGFEGLASKTEREKTIQALDDIARFKDGEGEALIKQAAARSSDGKVHFVDGQQANLAGHDVIGRPIYAKIADGSGLTSVSQTVNIIQLDFDQSREFGYRQADGSTIHASLTGMLVHELYHAADSLMRPEIVAMEKELDTAMRAILTDYHVGNADAIMQDLRRASTQPAIGVPLADILASSGEERFGYANELRAAGYPHFADALRALPAGAVDLRKMIRDTKIYDADGSAKWESDATCYTDAIMQKNYGAAEPQRGSYKNGDKIDLLPEPIVRPLSGAVFASPGFTADLLKLDPASLPMLPPRVAVSLDAPAHDAATGNSNVTAQPPALPINLRQ